MIVGEIGPRLGLNTNDNGFLMFKNYRIPRMNMLMRFSQVLEVRIIVAEMFYIESVEFCTSSAKKNRKKFQGILYFFFFSFFFSFCGIE